MRRCTGTMSGITASRDRNHEIVCNIRPFPYCRLNSEGLSGDAEWLLPFSCVFTAIDSRRMPSRIISGFEWEKLSRMWRLPSPPLLA